MSVTLQVQHETHWHWKVDVAATLLADGQYDDLLASLRHSAPPQLELPARLQLHSYEGALWTHRNMSALAVANRGFVFLRKDGRLNCYAQQFASHTAKLATTRLPAVTGDHREVVRLMQKRLLPSSAVLTRPLNLPGISTCARWRRV